MIGLEKKVHQSYARVRRCGNWWERLKKQRKNKGKTSLPVYNEKGEFQGMGVGQSSSLLKEVRECVNKAQIPLETALSAITSNPAEILCLKRKERILEGYDADLCILDQDLQLTDVIVRGKRVH